MGAADGVYRLEKKVEKKYCNQAIGYRIFSPTQQKTERNTMKTERDWTTKAERIQDLKCELFYLIDQAGEQEKCDPEGETDDYGFYWWLHDGLIDGSLWKIYEQKTEEKAAQ